MTKIDKVVYLDMAMMPITVCIAFSEKAFAKEIKKRGITEPLEYQMGGSAACVHFFEGVESGGLKCIMCLDVESLKKHTTNEQLGVITHESVHIYQAAKKFMGVTVDDDEIEAYSIQWITQKVFALYEKASESFVK